VRLALNEDMPISRQIRKLRLRKLLSLEQLGELSGLDKSYLASLEEGTEIPSYDELERLRDALGVPLWQLFYADHARVETPRLTPRPSLEELAAGWPPFPETRPMPTEASTGSSARHWYGTRTAPSHSGSRGLTAASESGSGLHWVQTRVGQVILFWGILELTLRALDAVMKSGLLLALRGSLSSNLEFLADPRVALVLVALAFGLLWASRPKKPVKSLLDQAEQPEPKHYSVVEATAIPFFLAFVCGVSLATFNWSAPDHERLARLTAPRYNQSLPGALQTTLQSAATAHTPAIHLPSHSAGQPRSSGETKPSRPSLPPLTPAIDQESEGAALVGNGSQAALNPLDPRAPVVNSTQEGQQTVSQAGQSVSKGVTPAKNTFDRIDQARKDQDWQLVATLCEGAIAETPQRLTPYLFAGFAYANLGQIDRAIDRLEYVEKNGAGNPRYQLAVGQATRLRESIRRQYGR
jgi:transcriptional regulator with XRE-family HTH domain